MLFFVYSAATTTVAAYRLLVLGLAVEPTWFKRVIWRDPGSWLLGMLSGGLLAAAAHLLTGRGSRP